MVTALSLASTFRSPKIEVLISDQRAARS